MSDSEDEHYLGSDSSEDEDLEFIVGIPRIRNENYLDVTVNQYDEETFLMHFRMRREHTVRLTTEYENSIYYKRQSGQYGKLSASTQMLIFLWFVGHQTAGFRDVSDRFNVTISSLNRIIRRVSVFLSNLSPAIIVWPTDGEKQEIEEHFRQNGFPGVIGAIDGSHIKLDKPENDPDSYINRKGFYSIQIQAVCDNNRRIRDIYVGYPGSVHDARVFRNSPVGTNLQQMCGRYYLLGDSAYPLKANLMVPFKDRGQLTQRQINFNLQLSKNRYIIEHTFGILKQKFRQLFHVKIRSIHYIVHLIRAACVLHNICLSDDFNFEINNLNPDDLRPDENVPPVDVDVDEDEDEDEDVDGDGRQVRDNLVATLRMTRN